MNAPGTRCRRSGLAALLTAGTMRAHRARWFVYGGGYGQPLVKLPRTSSMRGHWPGYDVSCSCGWESRTGGATRRSVEGDLWDHRYEAQCAAEQAREEALRIATVPYSDAQIAKANALIAAGGLTPREQPGSWRARSSDKKRSYVVTALGCECRSPRPCYHMCAVAMVETYQELETHGRAA